MSDHQISSTGRRNVLSQSRHTCELPREVGIDPLCFHKKNGPVAETRGTGGEGVPGQPRMLCFNESAMPCGHFLLSGIKIRRKPIEIDNVEVP